MTRFKFTPDTMTDGELVKNMLCVVVTQTLTITHQLMCCAKLVTHRTQVGMSVMEAAGLVFLLTNVTCIVSPFILFKLLHLRLRERRRQVLVLCLALYLGGISLQLGVEYTLQPDSLLYYPSWALSMLLQGTICGVVDVVLLDFMLSAMSSFMANYVMKLACLYVSVTLLFSYSLVGLTSIAQLLKVFQVHSTLALLLAMLVYTERVKGSSYPTEGLNVVFFPTIKAAVLSGVCLLAVYAPISVAVSQLHIYMAEALTKHYRQKEQMATCCYLFIIFISSAIPLCLQVKFKSIMDNKFLTVILIGATLYGLTTSLNTLATKDFVDPVALYAFILICFHVFEDNIKHLLWQITCSECSNSEISISRENIQVFVGLEVAGVHFVSAALGVVCLTGFHDILADWKLYRTLDEIASATLKYFYPLFLVVLACTYDGTACKGLGELTELEQSRHVQILEYINMDYRSKRYNWK